MSTILDIEGKHDRPQESKTRRTKRKLLYAAALVALLGLGYCAYTRSNDPLTLNLSYNAEEPYKLR